MEAPESVSGRVGLSVVALIAIGLAMGAVHYSYRWITGGPPLEWSWWQYAFAPIGFLLAWGVAEGVARVFFGIIDWGNPGHAMWKRFFAWIFAASCIAAGTYGLWYIHTAYR